MRPQGLAEAHRQRREARIAAAVLLVLVFVLAWVLAEPGSPTSVLTVPIGR